MGERVDGLKKISRVWGLLWSFAILMLGGLHVIPLWSLDYFPTQDGPSHIYNAHAFLQLFDDSNWRLDQVFRKNIGWIPNSLAHLFFVVGQGLGFDPMWVEKVFVTLVIIALPLSIHYVATAIDPRNWWVGLIGFILAFHNLLHMGFYSYSISVPLALFFLGTFLRWRFDICLRKSLWLMILGHLVFLSHFSSMAILLILLACVMGLDLLKVILPFRKEEGKKSISWGIWCRNGIVLLAVATPAFVYHLMAGDPEGGGYMGDENLLALLFDDSLLVTYTADHYQVVIWFWWLFALAFVFHVLVRITRRKVWEATDVFFLMAMALFWLYFDLPNQTHGGGWVNHRPLLFLLVFVWLALTRFPVWIQAVLGTLVIYISLYQLILFERDYNMLQPLLSEYENVSLKIEPHSTVSRKVIRSGGFPMSSLKVDPFLHAPCYVAMGKDMAYVQNYEADHKYFWVNRRQHQSRSRSDVMVYWGSSSKHRAHFDSKDDYELMTERTHLRVFQLKRSLPLWELDDPLKLRFSSSAEDGVKVISTYQSWEPGQMGFLERGGLRLINGSVRSYHPNTLRLDLPNGRYRVNLLLGKSRKATAFNLRVNDEVIYEHLESEGMGFSDRPSFPLEVKEGRADLVMSPIWKKGNRSRRDGFWEIAGLDLIPLKGKDVETGLEFIMEGWNEGGHFEEPIHVGLVQAGGNITYTMDGTDPLEDDQAWPKEGLELIDSTHLRVRRWLSGMAVAEAEGKFKKVSRLSPEWYPPLRLHAPGAIEGRIEDGPLEGYLKIERKGLYRFRSKKNCQLVFGGRELNLVEGEEVELWLNRGYYQISSPVNGVSSEVLWTNHRGRETTLKRSSLWLKP
jgi:hypothetical protein